MKQEGLSSVLSAFELLLEEVEDEIEHVNQIGGRAFAAGKYDQVDAARRQAEQLTSIRRQIAALRKDWQALAASRISDDEAVEAERTNRRDLGRLQRGTRTPEDAFRIPILQTLVDLGGSGKISDVLAKVEFMMKGQLRPADYESLPSAPNTAR